MQVPFVPTTAGPLRAATVLYDPRNEELLALLDAGSAFPAGVFAADEQVLLNLCSVFVGLNTFERVRPCVHAIDSNPTGSATHVGCRLPLEL